MPGQNKSPNLTPPLPKTIAFGGVLIRKGTPKDADTAIKIAVEGTGIKTDASGMSKTAVAVLLINADSAALAKHNKNRLRIGLRSANGTTEARSLTSADCSRSRPTVMPPAINRSVDQSIFRRSSFVRMPDKNTKRLSQVRPPRREFYE